MSEISESHIVAEHDIYEDYEDDIQAQCVPTRVLDLGNLSLRSALYLDTVPQDNDPIMDAYVKPTSTTAGSSGS